MPDLDANLRRAAAELIGAAAAQSDAVQNALGLVDQGRGSLVLSVSVGAGHVSTSFAYLPEHRPGPITLLKLSKR